jgi:hypothetical protein
VTSTDETVDRRSLGGFPLFYPFLPLARAGRAGRHRVAATDTGGRDVAIPADVVSFGKNCIQLSVSREDAGKLLSG